MNELLNISRQDCRIEGKTTVRRDILISNASNLKWDADTSTNQFRLVDKNFCNASTDRPKADNPYTYPFPTMRPHIIHTCKDTSVIKRLMFV